MMNPKVLLFLPATLQAARAEWPRFRGPSGDGAWECPGLPLAIDDPGRAWKQALGGGYSGVMVAAVRVDTMDRPAGEEIACWDLR